MQSAYYSYQVRPGDSLSKIVHDLYGIPPSDQPRRNVAVKRLLALNPQIKNADLIHPGQQLRLTELSLAEMDAQCRRPALPSPKAPGQPAAPLVPVPAVPEEAASFAALSWLEHNANWLTVPGGILAGAGSNLFHSANTHLIDDLERLYQRYQMGAMTRGQYDYQRSKLIKELARRIGPVEKLVFGGKTSAETLRIARAGGVPATANIAARSRQLQNLARLSKHSGILLAGVGLAAGCMQIASTENTAEKSQILVETASGTLAGFGVGVAVSFFLISNPVGWGVSLVLAVGGVAASLAVGKGAVAIYDKFGNEYDVVGAVGVDKLCS